MFEARGGKEMRLHVLGRVWYHFGEDRTVRVRQNDCSSDDKQEERLEQRLSDGLHPVASKVAHSGGREGHI